MKNIEELNKVKNRITIVELWDYKFKSLDISVAEFCRKYKFKEAHISRARKMKPLPYQRFIDRVEAAFEKEGV